MPCFILCWTCGTLLMTRPEVKQYFPINSIFKNGFSVPKRLDQNSKGSGILLYVREEWLFYHWRDIFYFLFLYFLFINITFLFTDMTVENASMENVGTISTHRNQRKKYQEVGLPAFALQKFPIYSKNKKNYTGIICVKHLTANKYYWC